jgi:hypothetical protein
MNSLLLSKEPSLIGGFLLEKVSVTSGSCQWDSIAGPSKLYRKQLPTHQGYKGFADFFKPVILANAYISPGVFYPDLYPFHR